MPSLPAACCEQEAYEGVKGAASGAADTVQQKAGELGSSAEVSGKGWVGGVTATAEASLGGILPAPVPMRRENTPECGWPWRRCRYKLSSLLRCLLLQDARDAATDRAQSLSDAAKEKYDELQVGSTHGPTARQLIAACLALCRERCAAEAAAPRRTRTRDTAPPELLRPGNAACRVDRTRCWHMWCPCKAPPV